MLRIAIPNKGSLSEGALQLVREAGYRCRPSDRELIVTDLENEVEFVLLRPRDIAVYVGNGTLELGITGRDLALDSGAPVTELLPLNFGRSRFFYAVPTALEGGLELLAGKRIATSYPGIVEQDLSKRGIASSVVRLDGAIEVSVELGVADAVADVVSSGRTLTQAGLKTIGEPILLSEAVLVARDGAIQNHPAVRILINRLKGIVVAREYAMLEYDIPKSAVEAACRITPGIESPTLAPLSDPEWMAVKAMTKQREINRIMDDLSAIGAKGILVTEIRTCRI